MRYTDDPVADFCHHDAEQQKKLDRLPVCDGCDNTITDDAYYDIDGTILCQECLDSNHKKYTDDFIE